MKYCIARFPIGGTLRQIEIYNKDQQWSKEIVFENVKWLSEGSSLLLVRSFFKNNGFSYEIFGIENFEVLANL